MRSNQLPEPDPDLSDYYGSGLKKRNKLELIFVSIIGLILIACSLVGYKTYQEAKTTEAAQSPIEISITVDDCKLIQDHIDCMLHIIHNGKVEDSVKLQLKVPEKKKKNG